MFHNDKHRSDGKTPACAECRTRSTVAHATRTKSWQSEPNKKASRRYAQKPESKEKASHASTRWQRDNPSKSVPYNRANAAYRRVKNMFPEALACDLVDTLPIYQLAYEREQQTGISHQVDHKIPLIGGGLHHPDNLEVLTKDDHIIKTNSETKLIRQLMTEFYKNRGNN